MVKISIEKKQKINEYIEILKKELNIKKVILFGSYAKGNNHSDSDIDLAIAADNFPSKKRVDNIKFLLHKTKGLKLDIEPIPITKEDLKNKDYLISITNLFCLTRYFSTRKLFFQFFICINRGKIYFLIIKNFILAEKTPNFFFCIF